MVKENAEQNVVDLEAFFTRQEFATAPAWRPESGDTIAYQVLQMKMGADAGYGPYPILVVRRLDNQQVIAIHAFHTLLREGLKELKVKPGGRYATTYIGTQEKNVQKDPEKPESYHMYYSEDLSAIASEPVPTVSEDFTF